MSELCVDYFVGNVKSVNCCCEIVSDDWPRQEEAETAVQTYVYMYE